MNFLSACIAFASSTNALLPLVTAGNKFYQLQEDIDASPVEFTVFGVDYQPGGSSGFSLTAQSDILTDPAACQRDAYMLQKLGANAIRIYSVSPWINHDECMTIFNDAGIYVLLDINTPDNSLNRYDPSESYNEAYMNNVFGLIDAFKFYPNLMGFIAGNEIINDEKSAGLDPKYIRAVIRDVKQYINKWAKRQIPVGYAAADVLEFRTQTWEYLQCDARTGNHEEDTFARADFFGINSYEWCSGVNDYQSSGYAEILSTFNTSSIPILFTEYGCNAKSPRSFDEVNEGIYGPLSSAVSGGFVYEYSNEVSNYGLVDIDSDGSVSMLPDYTNLASAFDKVTTTAATLTYVSAWLTGLDGINAAPTCNPSAASSGFNWNVTLPDSPASDLITSNGGNQNLGTLTSRLNTVSSAYPILDVSGSTVTPAYNYSSQYAINKQTSSRQQLDSNPSTSPISAHQQAMSTSSANFSSSSTSTAQPSSTIANKSKNGALPMALPVGLGGVAGVLLYLI